MHRWIWDLRATAPTATHRDYPIAAVPHRTPLAPQGPLVVPGLYTVRLTVDGKSETAPLTVKMDPRVHISQAELEALHAAQTTMAASLDALAKADIEAHSVMEQLNAVQGKALVTQLATFHTELETILDGVKGGTKADAVKQVPGIDEVTGEAAQLYNQLEQADANPTAALLAAASHVQHEGEAVLPGWENFKQTQIPEMNRQLQREHHPAIHPNQRPTNMPEEGDED
jgi:NADH dehydrogenase/NADH:ubiquinone oxidoreductase subunit G